MDRSTRRLDEGTIPASSTPEAHIPFNTELTFPTLPNSITVGVPPWSEWPDGKQMGTFQRHPSSPFPPETGKGTLEPGPSYER